MRRKKNKDKCNWLCNK